MDYLEIAKMAMKEDVPFITSEPIILTVVKPTINTSKPFIQTRKLDNSLLAKELVDGIKERVLSIGWTMEQLTDLQRTLRCFIPCHIGLITLQSIGINLLHLDGSIRGAVTFYNNEVDQPWLKYIKKGGGL